VPDWQLGAMAGAGALYSTVPDLLALLRAHLEPDGTSFPDALRLVQQPRVRSNRWLQVGLGWLMSPSRSGRGTVVWHNGRTGGFSSYVAFVPAAGVGVVVLADTARPVERLGGRLLSAVVASGACLP
jgi:CubicO group peptidase (beta-lactamase class C family)